MKGLIAARANALLIKRVTHIGGDTVRLNRGELARGLNCPDSWTSRVVDAVQGDTGCFLVLEAHEIFVMSDQREDGFDSRCFGPAQVEAVIGIVLRRLTSMRTIRLRGQLPSR